MQHRSYVISMRKLPNFCGKVTDFLKMTIGRYVLWQFCDSIFVLIYTKNSGMKTSFVVSCQSFQFVL